MFWATEVETLRRRNEPSLAPDQAVESEQKGSMWAQRGGLIFTEHGRHLARTGAKTSNLQVRQQNFDHHRGDLFVVLRTAVFSHHRLSRMQRADGKPTYSGASESDPRLCCD